jgi:ATP-dependent RNA helicase DeaD
LDVIEDYLKETLDLGRDDVFKVDVKKVSLSLTQIQNIPIKVMEILNVQLEGH